MSAGLGTAGERLVVTSFPGPDRRRDRWFFSGMAVAVLLTVFAGFARSYYLGFFFGAPWGRASTTGAGARPTSG
jgi:hypothetical protein